MKILSTKILSQEQLQLFSAFLTIDSVKVIETQSVDLSLDFSISENIIIFTSQNGVKYFDLSYCNNKAIKVYCVGVTTATYIEKKLGVKPQFIADNALELAQYIIQNRLSNLHIISGDIRRDELTTLLNQNRISYQETIVYKTQLLYPIVQQVYDAILFFSPSGVQSYLKNNLISQNTTIFAIGKTTATYLKELGYDCCFPDKPTVESLISTVNQYFESK